MVDVIKRFGEVDKHRTYRLAIGLKQQLSKIDNSSLNTTHSARNLGFIFDKNLTFSDQIQISSLSKSCYSHIRELCCIVSYRIDALQMYDMIYDMSKNEC